MNILEYICNILVITTLTVSNGSAVENALQKDTKVSASAHLKDLNRRLYQAIWDDKPEVVTQLIQDGAYVNYRDELGSTPLLQATMKDNTTIIEILLRHQADMNAVTNSRMGLLQSALSDCKLNAIETLIRHGADVHYGGYQAMYDAVDGNCGPAIKRFIKKNGFNVNGYDCYNNTPLAVASRHNKPVAIEVLLSEGANPIKTATCGIDYKYKEAPLYNYILFSDPHGHDSRYIQRQDIVDLFIKKGADVNHKEADGSTPLMIAAKKAAA